MVPLALSVSRETCLSCGNGFVPKQSNQEKCNPNCRRGRSKPKPVTFCAIDGEGLGADPSVYVLLSAGGRSVENRNGLTWKECFEFLYSVFETKPKGTAFVGFYLQYDFTQMLKSLPEDKAWFLFTDKGKAKRAHQAPNRPPHPVEFDGWQFDLLGMKRLRIRPKTCQCEYPTCPCKDKKSWMYICDVGGFWQSSFLSAIDPAGWDKPVVTKEEFALIKKGKEKRGKAVLDDDMRRYNLLENEILERAMKVLCEGFESVGIHLTPSQWFGPGQASAVWLGKHIEKSRFWLSECVPEWFLESARKSYFGGWFEIFAHGHIPGITHEYDINSAYPDAISRLPCLRHGSYDRGLGRPEVAEGVLCLVKARVFGRTVDGTGVPRGSVAIGTMLHRDRKGNISRPACTEGWYWLDELESAVRAGFVERIQFIEWVAYQPCECEPPFRDLADLYSLRLAYGKRSALGRAAKLLCNSGYGKFAQSIGSAPFGNAVYASRVTSSCRTHINNAIGSHPGGVSQVVMVATDAVFFLTPHPGLEVSESLGSFGHVEKRNLTLFKPGVYWDDKARESIKEGKNARFKARGVNAKHFSASLERIDNLFSEWTEDSERKEYPRVSFGIDFSMVTCLQALARGKWKTAGIDQTTDRVIKLTQDSNPVLKRNPVVWWDDRDSIWRSETIWFEDPVSRPYEKRFGVEDPFSEERKEELGVTEDGYVAESIRLVLKEE